MRRWVRLNLAVDSREEEVVGNAEVHLLAIKLLVKYLVKMLGAASLADLKVTLAITIVQTIYII